MLIDMYFFKIYSKQTAETCCTRILFAVWRGAEQEASFFSFQYIHDMVKLYYIGHTLVLNGHLVQIQHARQHFDHINTSGR